MSKKKQLSKDDLVRAAQHTASPQQSSFWQAVAARQQARESTVKPRPERRD